MPSPTQIKKTKAPVTDKLELSPTTPIPFEGGKGFSYIDNVEYLKFLDPDDNYAQLLLEARLLSATHNACVLTKKDYCSGSGFHNMNGKQLSKEFMKWLDSINLKDESAMDINKQSFESHFTFGNTPIELVRYTIGTKKYMSVIVHNFLEWRLGVPNKNGVSTYAVQSKLFLKNDVILTADDYKSFNKLPIYNSRNRDKSSSKLTDNLNWIRDDKGSERTLIWYKQSVTGFPNYGLPSAVSGLSYQILEFKGARYNLDNFENNMVVSAVLALKGSITQAEANRIGKQAIKNHTGDGKRGRVLVVASEDGIEGSDFHNMATHKDGSFKESDIIWSEKIILANQWDSVLAGLTSPSSLGKGSGFITKILEMKKNTVIKPAQNDLMKRVWHKIFNVAKDWLGFTDEMETIEIADRVDISALTDVDITPTVTVDEVRDSKGMAPLADKKKGAMLLGELGNEQKKGVYVKDTSKKSDD